MMHPSYSDLIATVNEDAVNAGEEPIVQSRYSIVLAAAKRARQLVDGCEPYVEHGPDGKRKALSVAVEELETKRVGIKRSEETLGEDALEPEREVVREEA